MGTGIARGEPHEVTAALHAPWFVPALSPAWLETSAAGDPSAAGGKSCVTAFPGQQSPSCCAYNTIDPPGTGSPLGQRVLQKDTGIPAQRGQRGRSWRNPHHPQPL